MESNRKFEDAIITSSEHDDFKACMEEWTVINIVENESINCLCGKHSKNHVYYELYNKLNKNVIYTAFDCLSKHLPDMKHFATVLCKQHTYLKNSKSLKKRMCHSCLKHNMDTDKPTWQNLCKNCWSSGIKEIEPIPILNYRMCKLCFIPNIDPSKSDYVDKCTTCFKNSKVNHETLKPEQLRSCTVCNELKIVNTKPDYIDKCDGCYKLSNVDKRQCKRCEKFNISSNAPKYVDKCTSCFIIVKEEEKFGPMRACDVCLEMNIPQSKPKYVNKCEACFKISKNSKITEETDKKIYTGEIPDFDIPEQNNYSLLIAMMSKNKI